MGGARPPGGLLPGDAVQARTEVRPTLSYNLEVGVYSMLMVLENVGAVATVVPRKVQVSPDGRAPETEGT